MRNWAARLACGSLVAALRAAGLGLIVDIVPNHMAAGGVENPWWADVLRHGRGSRYATFFDIDWDNGSGKVLAPVPRRTIWRSAARSAQSLWRATAMNRSSGISIIDSRSARRIMRRLPRSRPDAFDPATEAGRGRLHRLLERQHYRLAWWRSAGDAINWRRFFDINGLVALRMEDEAVFEATHGTLLRLYQQGTDRRHAGRSRRWPGRSAAAIAADCARVSMSWRAQRPPNAPKGPAWLVVEKILGAGERLPGRLGGGWHQRLRLHGRGERAAARRVRAKARCGISGVRSAVVPQILPRKRRRRDATCSIAPSPRNSTRWSDRCIASRVTRLETRDITRAAIRRALVALLAHFPVYRSYGVGRRSDALANAVAAAMKRCACRRSSNARAGSSAGSVKRRHPESRRPLPATERATGGKGG